MHAAFAPYARWLVRCGIDTPPTVAQLRSWAQALRLALPDACDDARLPRLLRAHAWRELFVDEADAVREHCRAIVVGHGLLDKLRRPFRAITAQVLVVAFAPGTLPAPGDVGTIDA